MDWLSEEIDDAILTLILVLWWRSKCRRRWSARPKNQLRQEQGEYWNLFLKIKLGDPEQFFEYTRMSDNLFDELLGLLQHRLRKRKTQTTLIPAERLALTLRYLATGDSFHSIARGFRVGRTTARKVILETCDAIRDVLSPVYLQRPTTADWTRISGDFSEMWNLPNCVGAIDGKHISVQTPPNSGSLSFNYKKHHSLVLMAICDAKYKFTVIDVGGLEFDNNAGIFTKSGLGRAMLGGDLHLPLLTRLPNSEVEFPYYFVSDEAFPLQECLMRPYPGRDLPKEKATFNYRLSRARCVIENAFGIFSSRWRVFRKPFLAMPDAVDGIVLAAVCLHNFIMTKEENLMGGQRQYCPPDLIDTVDIKTGEILPGNWRSDGKGLQRNGRFYVGNRMARHNLNLRDQLAAYCCQEGSVPWQSTHINKGH